MKIKIFNTLSKIKEDFKTLKPKNVKFYHCGPTLYWTQHIGNLRGVVMGDLIVRSLTYMGYKVTLVRNYTDVGHLTSDGDTGEDKMAKGAKREGLDPGEIAQKYAQIFENDIKQLNVIKADNNPRATEYVPQMIEMVQTLLDKGFAYATPLA